MSGGISAREDAKMHIAKKKMALAVSIALIGMHSAMAADDDTSLAPVTVVGHYDNSVGSSDAASQGVVRGTTLKDLPLLRPGEILETVPGLVVTQHSGDGKANQYFLRGYNLDHGTDFATTVNGVPVNMPTNAHGQGYSDLNFVMPELVDRIDYKKGPYFANTGDFSSAGSADILYVKKLDQNIINLTVGGNGYKRAVVAGSIVLGGPAAAEGGAMSGSAPALVNQGPVLLGALEAEHNDGPWVVKEGFKKTNAFASLSDGSTMKGWSINGTYYDAKWNSTDQVPLELIQSGQLDRYGTLDPTDGGEAKRAILSGEWHTHDVDGYAKVSAFAAHNQMQLWSNFTFFELRPATGDQFQQAESRNYFGAQAVKGWNHTLFGKDSVTEVGLQLRHDNIDVSLSNSQARVPFQTVTNNQVGETMSSLYLQNTTTWSDWFHTLAGVRGDSVAMNMHSYSQPENSGTASGKKLSPKLSLIFGPWAKTEFFINAGKGFHSNDARGVINKVDPTTGDPSEAVPALVGSFGKEVGVRTEWFDGLQSSLALWSLNSDSEIVYAADSAIGSTSPNGASKRYGIEWNNHWVANKWLLIDADLAWTHARYATPGANGSDGDFIPNAASKVGLLRATLHNVGPWTAGLETRYIGAYPLAQDGSLTAPSAIVTNLRLQRDINKNMSVYVDALNLFNRRYYDIAYQQDYQVSPSATPVPSGITVHPGEPRTVRVTLALKF
jgi:outer membrane receptor protein involved in Fe transport